MSYISVDNILLTEQICRLSELRTEIEEEVHEIRKALSTVSSMTLDDAEEDIIISLRKLDGISDELDRYIAKLRKILDLYQECEERNVSIVDLLPLNMPEKNDYVFLTASEAMGIGFIKEHLINLKSNGFTGHSVINEDWLDDLIY